MNPFFTCNDKILCVIYFSPKVNNKVKGIKIISLTHVSLVCFYETLKKTCRIKARRLIRFCTVCLHSVFFKKIMKLNLNYYLTNLKFEIDSSSCLGGNLPFGINGLKCCFCQHCKSKNVWSLSQIQLLFL